MRQPPRRHRITTAAASQQMSRGEQAELRTHAYAAPLLQVDLLRGRRRGHAYLPRFLSGSVHHKQAFVSSFFVARWLSAYSSSMSFCPSCQAEIESALVP